MSYRELSDEQLLAIAQEQDYSDEDPKCILRLCRAVESAVQHSRADTSAVGQSLLRPAISAANPLPPGCHCKPGQCMAPRIMGRQTPCRDPEKRDRAAAVGAADQGESA
jgi:hypothetical protein